MGWHPKNFLEEKMYVVLPPEGFKGPEATVAQPPVLSSPWGNRKGSGCLSDISPSLSCSVSAFLLPFILS